MSREVTTGLPRTERMPAETGESGMNRLLSGALQAERTPAFPVEFQRGAQDRQSGSRLPQRDDELLVAF